VADSARGFPLMNDQRRRRLADFPFWLLGIALLGVLTLWAIVSDQGYSAIFRALCGGVWTTLWVTLVAFGLAMLLGLGVALMRTSGQPVLVQIATFYTELVRGIPILVFLFYIAFVGAPATIAAANWLTGPLQSLGWMPRLTVRNFDLTWRAIIALTICYSAFIAEIFRAGIEAVQVEAARALGLGRWHIARHIVGPQAFRIILPPLGNDFVSMVKDSALVSALGVQDITQLGKVYSSGTFKFFETYNVVAFLYLTMTISLSLIVRFIERRLKTH
jgi:polar amino acid transport system permease protein